MDSKAHRKYLQLRRQTKLLKTNSFNFYVKLLGRLLEAHRRHEFLKPVTDALRARDWPKVYREADLLSAQKYADADTHLAANQIALLVKKYPWDSKLVELDPEKAALKSFAAGENRCERINRKFSILQIDPSRDKFRKESKIAMSWIRALIGSVPNYRSIARKCEFGQGASVGVHGDATHVLRKLSSEQEWTVTPGALHHGFAGLMKNPHYLETLLDSRMYSDGLVIYCYDYKVAFEKYLARIRVVNNNKLSFVLKTAKTHRSIATEAMLTGYYQKGIDEELKGFLLKFGLDLTDQSVNQMMALAGSLDDSEEGFVTIDLRNASNSNAREPVRYLYPRDWFALFERTRSHYYEHEGVIKPYSMLCSMGNGFCFPVETITFAAICIACGCGVPGLDFTVYGDDIIVRKKHGAKVLSMLKHYGFQANVDKTFLEGPFRESCGSDWFNGVDVRPFTLDFAFDSVESFFKYLNLTQRSKKVSDFFAPVREFVTNSVPIDFRFFRPLKGEVDSGIDSLGDEHLTSPHCKFRKENATWEWKELVRTPLVDKDRIKRWGHEPWLMGVAMRGSTPVPYGEDIVGLPSVTFRRKTRAEVACKSYSSTSNWLPTHAYTFGGRVVC
jgi:hypothetical protein